MEKRLKKRLDNSLLLCYNTLVRRDEDMRRSEHKRHDDLAAWDLDAGCRRIVDQSTPANRRLKKKLRRKARKTLDKDLNKWYNEDTNEGGQEA
jgi:hypothetical protein